ncbi:hypothetical protein MIZ03_1177 [Rhodoferax lithotrophicus]|uniref:Uncharacterized protein n=1 Tax=Rhodoferax lithotrophicus TaxID=2798804 RepID=A0ABN6D2W9_9BURK|nr:hypothetical protein MIZ03_1177 [Rhodoferax sp. MIZ03]
MTVILHWKCELPHRKTAPAGAVFKTFKQNQVLAQQILAQEAIH